ncbi:DUF2461 domain-containing protein [Pseudoalteromonas xiamenensis]|uniref:DUF2461 domain-containing protein n=1 Tax=Pseudoalteromonas xiamenensis TaxID=882626 RepID=UPI0035E5B77C
MFNDNTFAFLNELAQNNDREWFKANQTRYEENVRTPALNLIEAMAPGIHNLSPKLLAVAKKVGGSLMRVQRDTRFSHNKQPYKTNVGIQFRHFLGKDVHAPGLYLHLANDECFLGAGMWRPEGKALNAIRHCMDENPNAYKKALTTLTAAGFELTGESLQRPPRGYDKNHPLIEELKRKDFIAFKNFDRQIATSTDFSDWLLSQWQHTQPLMHYLCFALELDY